MASSTEILCSSFSSSSSSSKPDIFTLQKYGELLEAKDTHKGLRLTVDLTSSHSRRGSHWGFGTLKNCKHKSGSGSGDSDVDVFVRWAETASQRKDLKKEVGMYTKMMKKSGLVGDVVPRFYGLYARNQKQGLFSSSGLLIAIFEKIKGTKTVHIQSEEEMKFRKALYTQVRKLHVAGFIHKDLFKQGVSHALYLEKDNFIIPESWNPDNSDPRTNIKIVGWKRASRHWLLGSCPRIGWRSRSRMWGVCEELEFARMYVKQTPRQRT